MLFFLYKRYLFEGEGGFFVSREVSLIRWWEGGLFENLQHKSMVDLRPHINLCQIQLFVKQITYSPIWSYS